MEQRILHYLLKYMPSFLVSAFESFENLFQVLRIELAIIRAEYFGNLEQAHGILRLGIEGNSRRLRIKHTRKVGVNDVGVDLTKNP